MAQNAIAAAEAGDYSEVRRVLQLLQRPYDDDDGDDDRKDDAVTSSLHVQRGTASSESQQRQQPVATTTTSRNVTDAMQHRSSVTSSAVTCRLRRRLLTGLT